MSYQQPPDQNAEVPAAPPPGWYPDPRGLQVLRWWDGIQWSPHTQPPPGIRQEPEPQYPDAGAAASEGYGAYWHESAGRHDQQSGPQDGGTYPPSPVSGSYPVSFPDAQPQQQVYAPGPQPQAHHALWRLRKGKARIALIGLGALIAIIVAISVTIAHDSASTTGNVAAASRASAAPAHDSQSTTGNVAATSRASATSSAAADTSSAYCRSRATSWRDNGGLTKLQAVVTDMGNVQQAATALGMDLSARAGGSQDAVSLQTAAASLKSDAQTAQANLPPSCVPHLRTDYGTALNDASKAALDCRNAVSEMRSGSYNIAADDVNAANAAVTASGNKLRAADL